MPRTAKTTQTDNELRAVTMEDCGVMVEVGDDRETFLADPAFVNAVARIVREQLDRERKRRKAA